MNIILQQYSSGQYNIWEDVDLKETTGANDGLVGEYLIHDFNHQAKRNFKQICNWTYDDLYIVKDIYGGFLEFLKDEVI